MGVLMNIDAYGLRDIQVFLALLNDCESSGATELSAIRDMLSRRVTARMGAVRRQRRTVVKSARRCPSCGRGVLIGPYTVDRLQIMRCSVKCGYSEVTE